MQKSISWTVLAVIMTVGLTAGGVGAKERQVVKIFKDLQKEIVDISDGVKKSVVHIEVIQKSESGRRFRSLGSGVIVDSTGYVLTNEHVVGRSVSIKVTLEDKREFPATVIGVDKQTDLALLKIEVGESLPQAVLGNSDKVEVGEWVIAVGNPFGFDRTVSFGIVSGKGRVITDMPSETPLLNNFIQTDAAIDPGSSGGPLVNLYGEVIGINSIGIGRGQGFTIPSNMARDVVGRLRAQGSVDRGWLGVTVQPFNRSFARYYGADSLRGILVGDVQTGSPAEQAGLKPGDVLTRFGDTPVSAETRDDLNSFILIVSDRGAGDEVPLRVFREGQTLTPDVTIGQQPKVKADEFETPFGFTAKEITFNLARALRLPTQEGVLVDFVEVGGVAGEAELNEGDVVRTIEGRRIIGLEDFKVLVDSLSKEPMLLLGVQRGQVEHLVLLDLAESLKATTKSISKP